ncbi:hypothetical protein K2173_012819 [Erythroxylum novogranatense]|uniref:Extra-large guanine nucleotide-binding protein 1-like n=1 Tax=Erythroxylum novogranatense TaxID=1862640 RepID=A0AAV8S653_9ROSI|nr:hypothetical protein K2173_012819 [Erythroxylum novogranatense]
MAGLLRKILPGVSSVSKEDEGENGDHNNTEYSIALEYSGGPLSYDLPRAIPIDVDQIPVAVEFASTSSLSVKPLPVIQPIVRSNAPKKKLLMEPKYGSFDAVIRSRTRRPSNGNDMSGKLLDELHCLSASECEDSNMSVPKIGDSGQCVNRVKCRSPLSDGVGSSARSLSKSSKGSQSPGQIGEDGSREDFQDYMNRINCDSRESDLSSRSISSDIFSCKEEDRVAEPACHVRRPSAVTFCDPETNDVVQLESELSEAESSIPARRMAVRPGKKGTCYRCLKGNRFIVKEICIVCGAKYCGNCVMRAMGSMPEGRKCITCIGQRIDEAKRKTLGKLPSELIYVNREQLSEEELYQLQNCRNPPKKLEPGYYWYDKQSGYWGKEGKKPCQVISSQLDVGGQIQRDASNGDTNILINGREITKPEMRMLQFAGVKCEGATSLWVTDDGSYQEEGMNNILGNIWKKPKKVKLICSLLSLPTPVRNGGEENGVLANNFEQKTLHKLLLVGNQNSGTSTVFKQAKIVYNIPFSEEESQNMKFTIQTNLYFYLGILLEGREHFEQESLKGKRIRCDGQCVTSVEETGQTVYSISPRLKAFSDWLLKVMYSGNVETVFPAATRENAPFVEKLWKDSAIQATYNRRSELELLPRVATYFLERAVEIAREDYEPSNVDILYGDGITSSKGLSFMEFTYPKPDKDNYEDLDYQHDSSVRYQLIRMHPGALGGNCKWLGMFEDVDMILFCVSLTDYSEFFQDSNGVLTNKMMQSKKLFETIATHPTFEAKKFLLLLNKFDLLKETIEHEPLTRCEWFQEFNPVIGHNSQNNNSSSSSSKVTNPSLAHRAFEYIAVKFKRLFHSLTDKKLYVSLVTGLEPDNVDEALRYARDILKWSQEEINFSVNELSSTSIEASSSS